MAFSMLALSARRLRYASPIHSSIHTGQSDLLPGRRGLPCSLKKFRIRLFPLPRRVVSKHSTAASVSGTASPSALRPSLQWQGSTLSSVSRQWSREAGGFRRLPSVWSCSCWSRLCTRSSLRRFRSQVAHINGPGSSAAPPPACTPEPSTSVLRSQCSRRPPIPAGSGWRFSSDQEVEQESPL